MLEFLRAKSSDRKLRLFAVACCRRLFDVYGYGDLGVEEPLTWTEWYADGKATALDLAEIEEEAKSDTHEPCESFSAVAEAVACAVDTHNFDAFLVLGAVIRAANCCGYFESIREENEEIDLLLGRE